MRGYVETLFPAHAGMNRSGTALSASYKTIPRTRGDEPINQCTPNHARNLFPAHAGMNRKCGAG